ncbi:MULTISPECIES: D-alanyl-D-alanine carboxypeptidase family protein [Actinomadura]|uniref:D-alanyl-D-alanine carboxypeptidase family protein n=1 Tax=Actinomadura yumaensis TaxID=111807 RepID=A0ABW2CL34_9ACTN|nr:D-alanyl-D-alanine carboxypeptidase [Actinomadura sp. J1-007]MWK36824.1 D-alanyl-D-alanine carboxypeptidase [Actinomadura sp. J1-007]
MTKIHWMRGRVWGLAAGAAGLAMAVAAVLATGTGERPALPGAVAEDGSGLPWPFGARGALHVEGSPDTVLYGSRRPTPIASVAKVMTAYVFLKDRPLAPGRDGPVFTVSAEEAGRYGERLARQESLVPVRPGERYTQRQALEALLTVSANNVAHEVARWDAGGDRAFVAKMNAAARALGMDDTRYTDPSGFDTGTVSTAADQLVLLRAASRLPGFLATASRPWFEAPGTVGRVPSTDVVLGRQGIIAGKTGYTRAAGGGFVFLALVRKEGVPVLVHGVILGHRDAVGSALTCRTAPPLVEAAVNGLGRPRRTAEADRVQSWTESRP